MTLTASDKRLLSSVTRTNWPRNSLVILLAITVGGLIALGFFMMDLVQLDGFAREAGDHRTEADLRKLQFEAMIFLLIASTALMSAIFFCLMRRFGLLIRKLGDRHDA